MIEDLMICVYDMVDGSYVTHSGVRSDQAKTQQQQSLGGVVGESHLIKLVILSDKQIFSQ